ncbi:MAG: ABC transporter substrate-binding protein [Gammaproteobacteria bacterium]|nr:ABC transporter substrate-binding protein [Gammaproteobacteria bacterium]
MLEFSVLRGVCQIPAYVAVEKGFFRDEGLDVRLDVAATAWLVPQKLASGASQFALLPWTRVAAADPEEGLIVVAGSGFEEAAIVVRTGMELEDVRSVAVPLRGGMKDLTAMGLIRSMGWENPDLFRQPSGDGAIIAFMGEGVDAASMVEPYASMFEGLGLGRVLRRTGDLWAGAPGCSLATTTGVRDGEPELVQRVVNAFVRGIDYVHSEPKESARVAHRYIGVAPRFIERALTVNQPRADAIRNQGAMDTLVDLMLDLGYLKSRPEGYCDTRFLDVAQGSARSGTG